jgi:hypothetical protein
MSAIKKYIVIGEKRNGRFYKSEEFDLSKYFNKFKTVYISADRNIFQKFFNIMPQADKFNKEYDNGYNSAVEDIKENMLYIISNDKLGKKRK